MPKDSKVWETCQKKHSDRNDSGLLPVKMDAIHFLNQMFWLTVRPACDWLISMTVMKPMNGWFQVLTWVRYSEPGWKSYDVTTGVSPGLVSIAIRVARQQVGQCENVANEPDQHDGEDDLTETWERERTFSFWRFRELKTVNHHLTSSPHTLTNAWIPQGAAVSHSSCAAVLFRPPPSYPTGNVSEVKHFAYHMLLVHAGGGMSWCWCSDVIYDQESAQGVLFWKLTGCYTPFLCLTSCPALWLPSKIH